jgi:hypothetical protein
MSDTQTPEVPAEPAHALFSPSSAKRWMSCAGSVALGRQYPRTASKYASEGTAAHTLASRALEYNRPASFFLGEQIEADGLVFVVDEDMAGHVQLYLDEIRSRVGDGQLLIEQRISFSETVGLPGQFGTADAIILSADDRTLTVADLKYGMGVRVNAEENEQLMTYAVGVLESFAPILGDVEEVVILVIQPRLDHIDEWRCSLLRLRQHAAEMIDAVSAAGDAIACMDTGRGIPNEMFHPSTDACMWCPAKADCRALEREVASAVFNDFKALDEPSRVMVDAPPRVPGGERLGQLFGVLDLIEVWCKGVRAEVERQVMAGMEVIGPDGAAMKVVEGKRGNRSWTNEQEAEGLLVGLLSPEKAYVPRKIITPSAADKLLNKKTTKAMWETLQPLIAQAPGKPKVALGSDPAPSYVGNAQAEEFGVMGDD